MRRARVPLLAMLAIGASVAAVWQGMRRGEPPATEEGERSPPSAKPSQPAPSPGQPAASIEAEREAMRQFLAGLEAMLEQPADGSEVPAGGRSQGEPMPLPLPDHLQDAPPEEQHAYYVELLRHGQGMIELNREQMSEEDLAEAEAVMAKLRKRLEGLADAGTSH